MNLSRIALFSLLLLAACATRKPVRTSETSTVTRGACNPTPCLSVKLETLGELHPAVSGHVEEEIRKAVDALLYTPLEETEEAGSRDLLTSQAYDQFDEYLKISDAAPEAAWQLSRSASVLFSSPTLVSISVDNAGYLITDCP